MQHLQWCQLILYSLPRHSNKQKTKQLLTSHWPEISHMVIPNYIWEMQSFYSGCLSFQFKIKGMFTKEQGDVSVSNSKSQSLFFIVITKGRSVVVEKWIRGLGTMIIDILIWKFPPERVSTKPGNI